MSDVSKKGEIIGFWRITLLSHPYSQTVTNWTAFKRYSCSTRARRFFPVVNRAFQTFQFEREREEKSWQPRLCRRQIARKKWGSFLLHRQTIRKSLIWRVNWFLVVFLPCSFLSLSLYVWKPSLSLHPLLSSIDSAKLRGLGCQPARMLFFCPRPIWSEMKCRSDCQTAKKTRISSSLLLTPVPYSQKVQSRAEKESIRTGNISSLSSQLVVRTPFW